MKTFRRRKGTQCTDQALHPRGNGITDRIIAIEAVALKNGKKCM